MAAAEACLAQFCVYLQHGAKWSLQQVRASRGLCVMQGQWDLLRPHKDTLNGLGLRSLSSTFRARTHADWYFYGSRDIAASITSALATQAIMTAAVTMVMLVVPQWFRYWERKQEQRGVISVRT